MSAVTQQQPVVPPRPARKQDGPSRHLFNNRSISPNPDRFAPSPINESPFSANKSPTRQHFSPANGGMAPPSAQHHIGRSPSVDLPMVGEEGNEYALIADELNTDGHPPEHTRTVGDELKIHAPKPSLPAVSAKQRVAAVTRTDSDRAASFGIGKPSLDDSLAHFASSNRSLKKKASTTSQQSASERVETEDEHGIPEIGIQVPMYPNAGDVQAPSPAPHIMSASGTGTPVEGAKRHHKRKGSSRGFEELPPGSYGLHGHGVKSTDKLDKAYYDKHPELAKLEHHHYQADRANDFSMSSEDLNKIVRSTASRGTGFGTHDLAGTPSEQIGWKVTDELTSRVTSPRPASAASKRDKSSSLSKVISNQDNEAAGSNEDDIIKDVNVIHVDDPNGKRRSVMFSDEEDFAEDDERYNAPILADDEVAKDPSPYHHTPAVEPPRERRGSAHEMEESHSRPTSRPASLYKESSFDDFRSTPLDDVKEYEPLFPEDEKAARKAAAKKLEQYKQRFPSRDIWEDAPNSVHYTAEVHTPDVPDEEEKLPDVPDRSCETPAQAFARQQEELAEKESRGDPEAFHHRKPAKPPTPWAHQAHLAQEVAASRPSTHRFPSRDIWEDTPDSACLSTTVSTPQRESEPETVESSVPEIPQRPARKQSTETSPVSSDKPVIPERPKPKQTPSEESGISKPVLPDRPKPQVPARPAKKLSGSDKDTPVGDAPATEPRSKPAVPARPMGSKIAALQAGFMSDLNKKLGLGPQAPKKEEPAEEEQAEEQEKAPLVDARKGRARGPQRRAPKASPSPAAKPAAEGPKLSFTLATTMFSIDPDDGNVSCDLSDVPKPAAEEDVEVKKVEAVPVEKTAAPVEQKPIVEAEEEKEEEAEEKTQSLVTNTAGETVLETKLADPAETKYDAVEPIAAAEVAKD